MKVTLLYSFCLTGLLSLCTTKYTLAQKADSLYATTLFDTLKQEAITKIKVSLDLDSLRANKLNDSEIRAIFEASNADDEVRMTLPVKVSVRSKSRRRYCSFPPLKFNFSKTDLQGMKLSRDDEYKIVTHCLDEKADESHLLKEFMVYKLYNLLTPISLDALLVDIEYYCQKQDTSLKRRAILLETFDELAQENGGEPCNCMGTPLDSLDRLQYELVAMLQFMVGNSDMDHRVERNVKLIKTSDDRPWIPVAYDFDYACIVNAPYVYPKLDDNRSIRTKYLGFKENAEYLPEVKKIFIDKKDDILRFLKDFPGLDKADKRITTQYIKDFYKKIEDKNYEIPYKDP